ncbi:MAG: DUF3489 domain-containing protein [Alphaproteobacteria bacterium]|nr:DUF3489 domain-containing protein [Alphaproteobacteria bacterium]
MATSKKKTTKSKSKSNKTVTPKTVETPATPQTTIIPDVVLEAEEHHETTVTLQKQNKTQAMVELLTRENGATLEELAKATGWLVNSVRGALSAYAKKHPEYSLISEKMQGVRTYRLSPNWHD